MSERNTQPAIRLDLGGIEDFSTAVAMLRATGARRWHHGRNLRTFVIDHDITAQQAAALIEFIQYGTGEGFLEVETSVPEPDYEGAEDWWDKA